MIFHCFVAICLVLECVGMNEGFLITPPQFSLRSGSFLLSYTMRTILSMFLLGNWVFKALICEAVIFLKSGQLVCMLANLVDYTPNIT